MLIEADDLADAAKRLGDPLTGTLRIGVIPTVSPYLLPEVVPTLRRRLPLLTIQWIEDKTDVLVGRLQAGTLDAALLALEARLGDLEQDVIAIDPFVLAMPRGHALARRRSPAHLEDLKGIDVLLMEDGQACAIRRWRSAPAGELRLDLRATSLPRWFRWWRPARVTLLTRLARTSRRTARSWRSAIAAPYRTAPSAMVGDAEPQPDGAESGRLDVRDAVAAPSEFKKATT